MSYSDANRPNNHGAQQVSRPGYPAPLQRQQQQAQMMLGSESAMAQPGSAGMHPQQTQAGRRSSSGHQHSLVSNLPPTTQFPLLPPELPSPGQVHQNVAQMQSILNMPPALLHKLARSNSTGEQQNLVRNAHVEPYLPSMRLPPPSPSDEPWLTSAPTNATHAGIPHLLNQIFSPHTSGILAIAEDPVSRPFQPIYSSMDEWVVTEVRHLAENTQNVDPQHMNMVAAQLKSWAIEKQEVEVSKAVLDAKGTAVNLAAAAAAQKRARQNSVGQNSRIGHSPLAANNMVMPSSIDLSAYAEHYKMELNAHAQGYYSQLHREALKRLTDAEQDQSQPTAGPSNQPDPAIDSSKLVRASAVAALTANVLAAQDMAAAAGQTLSSMGVDVPTVEASMASPSFQHQQNAVSPHMQRYPGSQAAPTSAPYVPASSSPYNSTPVAISAALGEPADAKVVRVVNDVQANNGCSIDARDYLLQYGHTAYSSGRQDVDLLPLLHMLDNLHPGHCPTLLLLSCVYYSKGIKGDLPQEEGQKMLSMSIAMNQKILEIDGTYVEALSNIGTTCRALGKSKEAEYYWYEAIKIRPHYFDSVENLLGVLCHPQNGAANGGNAAAGPRYSEALRLCQYIEDQLFGAEAPRPYSLPKNIPLNHTHRLQNLFYAKGNLQSALQQPFLAKDEYEKGVEIMLSASKSVSGDGSPVAYTVAELLVATVMVGLVLMAQQGPGTEQESRLHMVLEKLGIPKPLPGQRIATVDYLKATHKNAPQVLSVLHQYGGGFVPMVLLFPTVLPELKRMLFVSFKGYLPAIHSATTTSDDRRRQAATAIEQTSQTTSTLLLTLAKTYQEAMSAPQGQVARDLVQKGTPPHSSILLPLYYLALALHPSPSTYNNLGILLSTIPASVTITTAKGLETATGQTLAMAYYKAGLEKDPKHPHLYTNLGSLFKDMGHLQQAISMYEKAVECNSTFDVALANLANAIKDLGHVQESIPWYYKAVQINPNFPEAVCGLVNALGGVCDWHGRGGVGDDLAVGNNNEMLDPRDPAHVAIARNGWMPKIVELVSTQLATGSQYGRGIFRTTGPSAHWLKHASYALGLTIDTISKLAPAYGQILNAIYSGQFPSTSNEGGVLIRLIERLMRRTQRRWYIDTYGKTSKSHQQYPRIQIDPQTSSAYQRPILPPNLSLPPVPTVLPFHTFTYPLSARQTRLISHRNALRISHSTLTQPWLPSHVYPPPPPPSPKLHVGYVSSDFNNHPLAHLMQSVFGMHDLSRFEVFCYATTASDSSEYRTKISTEAQHFVDVSAWSNQQIVEQIVRDGIHILVNMNGYTKGARNEIFAARPCPIQIQQLMGFAGTLASGWCDWILADKTIIPPDTVSCEVWRKRRQSRPNALATTSALTFEGDLDPEEESDEWSYTEKIAYVPKTYFVTDHKQGFRDELPQQISDRPSAWAIDEQRRWQMRQELFPTCRDDTVIFCCLNQLYKIDPLIFRTWLNILAKVPNSILWLLRFPAPGEAHLKQTATQWANEEVASRIVFTDVSPKQLHIARGRIGDLFLDSTEVGGHTTSADVLWSGTPVLTYPRHKHKLCSRVAASIVASTGFGDQMVVNSIQQYEDRAVQLANSLKYTPDRVGSGELYELRRKLFMSREDSALFDTLQWTRNAENAYEEIWRRWTEGTEFEDSAEWQNCVGPEKESGCIYL